jgi:hypothetical protein
VEPRYRSRGQYLLDLPCEIWSEKAGGLCTGSEKPADVVNAQADSGNPSRQGTATFNDIAARHGIEMINPQTHTCDYRGPGGAGEVVSTAGSPKSRAGSLRIGSGGARSRAPLTG